MFVVQSSREGPMATDFEEILKATNDPVTRLLLSDSTLTLREAEERYLDACLPEVIQLLEAPLSEEELGRHPLMIMLRWHGSRGWEESVD
jgi:hypothetical protein